MLPSIGRMGLAFHRVLLPLSRFQTQAGPAMSVGCIGAANLLIIVFLSGQRQSSVDCSSKYYDSTFDFFPHQGEHVARKEMFFLSSSHFTS